MFFVIFLCLSRLVALPADDSFANEPGGGHHEDSDYVVRVEDSDQFLIRSAEGRSSWTFKTKGPITYWKLSPTGDYLSYRVDGAKMDASCLLDLKSRRSWCSMKLDMTEGEDPWNPSGEWLIWRTGDQSDLFFARAESAEEFPDGLKPQLMVGGHPLGSIRQELWLDANVLIWSTGYSEFDCYGAVDLEQRRAFYLACCSTPQDDLEECGRASRDPKSWLTDKGLLPQESLWIPIEASPRPWATRFRDFSLDGPAATEEPAKDP